MTEKTPQWARDPVTLEPGAVRMSAEAMRGLKKATGRSMTDLLQDDDDEANRLQVMAYGELWRRAHRLGHLPDAATMWDYAGMVELEFVVERQIDPLEGGSSTTSPHSAATGE